MERNVKDRKCLHCSLREDVWIKLLPDVPAAFFFLFVHENENVFNISAQDVELQHSSHLALAAYQIVEEVGFTTSCSVAGQTAVDNDKKDGKLLITWKSPSRFLFLRDCESKTSCVACFPTPHLVLLISHSSSCTPTPHLVLLISSSPHRVLFLLYSSSPTPHHVLPIAHSSSCTLHLLIMYSSSPILHLVLLLILYSSF